MAFFFRKNSEKSQTPSSASGRYKKKYKKKSLVSSVSFVTYRAEARGSVWSEAPSSIHSHCRYHTRETGQSANWSESDPLIKSLLVKHFLKQLHVFHSLDRPPSNTPNNHRHMSCRGDLLTVGQVSFGCEDYREKGAGVKGTRIGFRRQTPGCLPRPVLSKNKHYAAPWWGGEGRRRG